MYRKRKNCLDDVRIDIWASWSKYEQFLNGKTKEKKWFFPTPSISEVCDNILKNLAVKNNLLNSPQFNANPDMYIPEINDNDIIFLKVIANLGSMQSVEEFKLRLSIMGY